MGLALTILAWLVAGMIAILVVLLVTPIRFWLHMKSEPMAKFELVVRPFGGVCPPLKLSGRGRKPRTKERTAPRTKRKPRTKGNWRGPIGRAPAILAAVPRLVSGLLRQIRIEYLKLDGEFGIGDPADTGHVFGMLTPVLYGSAGLPRTAISLRPNFDQRCLSGEIETSIRVTPATLIPPIIGFVWVMFGPRR